MTTTTLDDAHSDEWEKRWAQDAVTNAQGAHRREIRDFRTRMGTSFFQAWTPYDDWHRYESLRVGVAARQEWVRGDIARAQDVLAAVRSVEESMGSATPPSEPSPDPGS